MTSIRKTKKQIANYLTGDAIREIAQMQAEIDRLQELLDNILLMLWHPGNHSLISNIPQENWICNEIIRLQKENKELKEKITKMRQYNES